MLPRSTHDRTRREAAAGKQSGRTQEIQRLIGRSLRAVTNLAAMPDKQIVIDCDVLQADGGTRTASITGAWVALHDALAWMEARSMISGGVLRDHVAAVSCGLYGGEPVLDLDYAEDSEADADANFVMTGKGGIVEVQGTAETEPFSQEKFDALMGLARTGIGQLVEGKVSKIAQFGAFVELEEGIVSGEDTTAFIDLPDSEGNIIRIIQAEQDRN